MSRLLSRFRDQTGASLVEYALIASLIAIPSAATLSAISTTMNEEFNAIEDNAASAGHGASTTAAPPTTSGGGGGTPTTTTTPQPPPLRPQPPPLRPQHRPSDHDNHDNGSPDHYHDIAAADNHDIAAAADNHDHPGGTGIPKRAG
jgi:Flp pilus assembly pilin Flp